MTLEIYNFEWDQKSHNFERENQEMLDGVNSNGTRNLLNQHIIQNNRKSLKQDDVSILEDHAKANNIDKVDISDEGKKMLFASKEDRENQSLISVEEFFNKDVHTKRKLDFANKITDIKNIDPFDNEFLVLGVTYTFSENTLEKSIADYLNGKSKNPSLVANELAQMIKGTIFNPEATVEERGINREIAMKNAKYIAEKYFENQDEAEAFMNEISRYAENDIMREKGYVVLDNSELAPFRSYTTAYNGSVSWRQYAEKYGTSDLREIFENPIELEAFVNKISNLSPKWDDEIVKEFEAHENHVAEIIRNVKNTLDEKDITNSMERLLKAF